MEIELEKCTGPEHPLPRQRAIAELSYNVHPTTGVITNKQKTGNTYTRQEWNSKGFFFPRWGQTVTLARA